MPDRRHTLAALAAVLAFAASACTTAGPSASSHASGCPTSQPATLDAGASNDITFVTTMGTFVARMPVASSPIAVSNFTALASCHFYDNVIFHRIAYMEDGSPFVIQGGDPTGTGSGGPGYFIADEPVTGTYRRGTIAMARSSQPNSQGSQFCCQLSTFRYTTPASNCHNAVTAETRCNRPLVSCMALDQEANRDATAPLFSVQDLLQTISGGSARLTHHLHNRSPLIPTPQSFRALREKALARSKLNLGQRVG